MTAAASACDECEECGEKDEMDTIDEMGQRPTARAHGAVTIARGALPRRRISPMHLINGAAHAVWILAWLRASAQ